jgi:hypothetical protein
MITLVFIFTDLISIKYMNAGVRAALSSLPGLYSNEQLKLQKTGGGKFLNLYF